MKKALGGAAAVAGESASVVLKQATKAGVTGTAAGGASVGIFHSFEDYVENDTKDVNGAIKDWSVTNSK